MDKAYGFPLQRVVGNEDHFGRLEEYVVTMYQKHLTLRPLGTKRDGPQEVTVTYAALHLHLTAAKVEAELRAKRRRKA